MPASTYRSEGDHIPVATASANLTGGHLTYQEGWFGVVITSCSSGESTELDVTGIHNVLVPANTIKGDALWAAASSDVATLALSRDETTGAVLVGKAVSDRDSATGRALVKFADQPYAIQPIGASLVLAQASATLTVEQSGTKFVTVESAELTLPAVAAANKGVWYELECGVASAAQGTQFKPNAADHIRGNGLSDTDGHVLVNSHASDRVGDMARIYSDGVHGWVIEALVGTWAKAAA